MHTRKTYEIAKKQSLLYMLAVKSGDEQYGTDNQPGRNEDSSIFPTKKSTLHDGGDQ